MVLRLLHSHESCAQYPPRPNNRPIIVSEAKTVELSHSSSDSPRKAKGYHHAASPGNLVPGPEFLNGEPINLPWGPIIEWPDPEMSLGKPLPRFSRRGRLKTIFTLFFSLVKFCYFCSKFFFFPVPRKRAKLWFGACCGTRRIIAVSLMGFVGFRQVSRTEASPQQQQQYS